MLNTIHRSIVERFHVEVTDTIVNVFSDNDEAGYKRLEISDEEKFKDALKRNIPCTVHRETFVVEYDDEKNKVIFKKYFVRKNSAYVKKISSTKLKTYKAYKSLSVDMNTGEFSIYTADVSSKKKQSKPFIRQSIFTAQVLTAIEGIFENSLIENTEILTGINKALALFGVRESVIQIVSNDRLKIIFNRADRQINLGTYFNYFLIVNYLKKMGLNEHNDYNILEQANNFRLNKKNYIGKSIYQYYADHFRAEESFVRYIFQYRDQLNIHIHEKNKNKKELDWWDSSNTKKENERENYYHINAFGLTILYNLGYTIYDIKTDHNLLEVVYNRNDSYGSSPFNTNILHENISLLSLDVLVDNKEFFKSMIKQHPEYVKTITQLIKDFCVLRDVYGVKIDMETLYYCGSTFIFKSLGAAVETTGIYTVSKNFLSRLKKQLPQNTECGITKNINKKINLNEQHKGYVTGIISGLYNGDSEKRFATLILTHKKTKLKLMVGEDYINHREFKGKTKLSVFDFDSKKEKTSELTKSFYKFNSNFNKNKNKSSYVGLKAHYSRAEFEKLLSQEFSEKDFKMVSKNLVYLK